MNKENKVLISITLSTSLSPILFSCFFVSTRGKALTANYSTQNLRAKVHFVAIIFIFVQTKTGYNPRIFPKKKER